MILANGQVQPARLATSSGRETPMKSALQSVAFSQGCEFTGIMALLETALGALEESGSGIAAAYVDMAISAYAIQASERAADSFAEITHCG